MFITTQNTAGALGSLSGLEEPWGWATAKVNRIEYSIGRIKTKSQLFSPSHFLNQRLLSSFPKPSKGGGTTLHFLSFSVTIQTSQTVGVDARVHQSVPGKCKPFTQPRQQHTLCLTPYLPETSGAYLMGHRIQLISRQRLSSFIHTIWVIGPQALRLASAHQLLTIMKLIVLSTGGGPFRGQPAGWSRGHGGRRLHGRESGNGANTKE